jgi:hypothetical protein
VQSAEGTVLSQLHHQERQAWSEILAHVPADPHHKVVLCALCHRVRGEESWSSLPPGIEHELLGWKTVLLSHGYCPECLEELEAAQAH